MFDKIFNLLFEKKPRVKCVTVIKNRAVNDKDFALIKKENKQEELTCLSSYFKNRKGLNVSERERFYGAIFNARNPQ